MSEIPNWLKSHLQEQDLDRIQAAIHNAEKKTSGEIVPMIVRRSSTVGHVPLVLTLVLLLLVINSNLIAWQSEVSRLPFWILAIFDGLCGLVLIRTLSLQSWVQRLLTPKADQKVQVESRALIEFYNHRINATERSTGILVFVSLMEHMAVVLGDKAIAQKLKSEDWHDVDQKLLQKIAAGDMADGFCEAIQMCGDKLATHFPNTDRVDYLPNHLIIKDE